jgi:transposase
MEAERLVFLDETGSNVAMARRYGRAPRGRPVYGSVPHNRGKNLTVVAAISASGGLVAHRALDGAMTAAAFLAFVTEALIPALRPGQVVVMDNLSAHKAKGVREAFRAAGVGVRYLPRYSPELNPIELCWARVKGRLRAVAARAREALRGAVAEALARVGVEEIRRWVRHCGYRLTSKRPSH